MESERGMSPGERRDVTRKHAIADQVMLMLLCLHPPRLTSDSYDLLLVRKAPRRLRRRPRLTQVPWTFSLMLLVSREAERAHYLYLDGANMDGLFILSLHL